MRRAAACVVAAALTLTLPAVAARAQTPLPPDAVLTIPGHGWGHGRGMGQWGAKGMADQGKNYREILSYYYSSVEFGDRGDEWLRVLVEASPDVVITSESSFKISYSDGEVLATSGDAKPFWRVIYTGGAHRAQRSEAWNGPWETVATDTRYMIFAPQGSLLEVVFGNGTVRRYRGNIIARYASVDGMRTINSLRMEDYLRGVVPRESPSGWPAEQLKSQAVAARTYAYRKRDDSRSRGNTFDICATTACQVYGGAGQRSRPGGAISSLEASSTDGALSATKGTVLNYAGKAILAEYSSSTGGYTAPGSVPYQKAVPDPTDAVSPHHEWTAKVSVREIESTWPAIGRLVRIEVTERNGFGEWGGRVKRLRIVGSSKTIEISGDAFRGAFAWPSKSDGLRSSWFTIGYWASERVLTPGSTTIPRGQSKQLTYRFRNLGTEPWPVGGTVGFSTDAGSSLQAASWPSPTRPAWISRNVTRPAASSIAEGEVAELIVALDTSSAPVGSVTLPLRLEVEGGTRLDAINLKVDVVPSWFELAPNILSNGSFEKGLWAWSADRASLVDGRDLTRGVSMQPGGSITQTVNLAGGSGRRFMWGAWTSADQGADLEVKVLVTFADGRSYIKRLAVPGGPHDWTYTEQGFRTAADRQVSNIRFEARSVGGSARLDAVRLIEDPVANSSFEQDELTAWSIPLAPADAPFARTATWTASDGDQALIIPGRVEPILVEQRFALDAPAWERYSWRFSHRSYQSTAGQGSWLASLTLVHPDGTETVSEIPIDTAQHPWESARAELVARKPVTEGILRFRAEGQTGSLYMDQIRVFRSRVSDASFEAGDLSAWNTGGLQPDDQVATWAARDGDLGLRLTGPARSFVTQNLVLRGTPSRTFRLAAWNNSSRARSGRVDVAVTFFHTDGTRSAQVLDFTGPDHAWTYREIRISSAKRFDGVRVAVMLDGPSGWTSFDSIRLIDA
ncbi:MAG: SpoIID/LytB domain-containing protein [Actinomycetota bacterium]